MAAQGIADAPEREGKGRKARDYTPKHSGCKGKVGAVGMSAWCLGAVVPACDPVRPNWADSGLSAQ